jgi:hypothetical protein
MDGQIHIDAHTNSSAPFAQRIGNILYDDGPFTVRKRELSPARPHWHPFAHPWIFHIRNVGWVLRFAGTPAHLLQHDRNSFPHLLHLRPTS